MSQRAYARYRRSAVSSIQKAIRTHRISTLPDGQIDSDIADAEWSANTLYPSGDSGVGASHEFRRARTIRESYSARVAKLNFEQKAAQLVLADEARVAEANAFRKVSAVALAVADNVAAAVAAESDEAVVHSILSAEIRKMLSDFADAMAAQASA